MKVAALLFLLSLVGCAPQKQQQPQPKQSPAAAALVGTAKQRAVDQVAYDAILQQANGPLTKTMGEINQKIAALNKQIQDELAQDPKYKPQMDQLIALQKQSNDTSQAAQQKFFQDTQGLRDKLIKADSSLPALEDIVRKENNWPVSTSFNTTTQTWEQEKAPHGNVASPKP